MKKILLFIGCLFLSITSVGALDIDYKSENVVLYNFNNGEVIYEKDADEVVSIASMTKIITSLVLIENIDNLNTKVILQPKHFVGLKEWNAAVAGFRVGQTVTYKDLLYGIAVPSGADAVQALAIEVFGSNEALVRKMNQKVSSMGLKNTKFTNPYGMDEDGHYSTVREVYLMLQEALKNELFKEMFTTRRYLTSDKSITLYSTIMEPLKTLGKNANYIVGAKTGYTDDAGRCLASLGYDEDNDIYYLMVTAGASKKVDPIIDAMSTYEYLFENYKKYTFVSKDEIVKQIKTKYAKEKKIDIKATEEVSIYLENKDYDENKITFNYNIPDKVNKILEKDSKLGTLTVLYDGKELKTMDLVTAKDMHFSFWKLFLTTILPLTILGVICVIFFKKRK